MCFLTVMESGSPRSRCQQICFSWGLSAWLVDGHLLVVSSHGLFFCAHTSLPLFMKILLPLFMKIEVLLDKDSILRTSCKLQFSSVTQSCPILCDPMNCSTPGLPVHHQLPEFTQTHVHWVSDAIQPSHPLSSPSPPAPNPAQHQSLFQWANSLITSVKATSPNRITWEVRTLTY